MNFQRRTWTAQRIGWALMALVLLAAALGLFASGPLSRATVRDPQGLVTVEYGRIQRQTAPDTIRLHVAPAGIAPDGVTVMIDEAFARVLQIRTIWPAPEQSTATADGIRIRFQASPGEPATIHFHISPQGIGFSRPRLGLAGRDAVELPIFIYP